MATVFERVNKLGLAHSNHILQMLGQTVKFKLSYVERIKVKEQQGNDEFYVNYYPAEMTPHIDRIILEWLKCKDRFEKESRFHWWWSYKANRV